MCATAPRSQPPLLKHCASHAKVVACEQINVHGRVAAIEKHQFPWKRSTFVREQTFVHGKRVVNNYVVHGRAAASEKHQFPWKRSTFVREQTFVHGKRVVNNYVVHGRAAASEKHQFPWKRSTFVREQTFVHGKRVVNNYVVHGRAAAIEKNIMKPSIFYQEYEFSCVINNSLAGRTTFDPGLKSWNLRCDKVAVSKCLRFLE
jgi:hypothetical protein